MCFLVQLLEIGNYNFVSTSSPPTHSSFTAVQSLYLPFHQNSSSQYCDKHLYNYYIQVTFFFQFLSYVTSLQHWILSSSFLPLFPTLVPAVAFSWFFLSYNHILNLHCGCLLLNTLLRNWCPWVLSLTLFPFYYDLVTSSYSLPNSIYCLWKDNLQIFNCLLGTYLCGLKTS